jgi:ABC-2 type transport system ATP-binding protein
MIEARGLTKAYQTVQAVKGIDLDVRAGEIFGFLGPNGAGKTTTIKMLVGLLQPSGGTIAIDGVDLAKDPVEAKRRFGFIPDRPYLYNKLTGREFLRFTAGLYRLGGDWPRRMEDLLRLFELADRGDELVEGYSHGMRQRLVFCGAFLHRPQVLIVDEPMVGLDPKGARLLKRVLREYAAQGNAIFMSTHTLEVAEEVCDRIAIIDGGEIIALGTMEELRARATGGHDLESIFLHLTGGAEEDDLIAVLRD